MQTVHELENPRPKCPYCGTRLTVAGLDQWDCRNFCFPLAMTVAEIESAKEQV